MQEPGPQASQPDGLAARSAKRLAVAAIPALAIGLLLPGWNDRISLLVRTTALALVATLAFGWFERWPKRLPAWCARWALQVFAVGVCMPLTTVTFYLLSTPVGAPPFWREAERLTGFVTLSFLSTLLAPWIALAAVVRQKDALAREQALIFDLQRSEYERQALDGRLRLLQAQVTPHFLFNTLANVQALVEVGSPRAPEVLRSLVAYLRAAIPVLDEPAGGLGRELKLARAYLELMQMRMPDRLQYEIQADTPALGLRCPPTMLLTLVENAVRHGIDPSEEGGRIQVDVRVLRDRCLIRVSDSGVGLRGSIEGRGMGLATLREGLSLMFGEKASLRVAERVPRGVCAEVDIPATAEQVR